MTSIKPSCAGSVSSSRESMSKAGYQKSTVSSPCPCQSQGCAPVPTPGEDSREENGARGQAQRDKEAGVYYLLDMEGAWPALGCSSSLVLPAAFLWLIWICGSSSRMMGCPHLAVFSAGPVGNEPRPQRRGAFSSLAT